MILVKWFVGLCTRMLLQLGALVPVAMDAAIRTIAEDMNKQVSVRGKEGLVGYCEKVRRVNLDALGPVYDNAVRTKAKVLLQQTLMDERCSISRGELVRRRGGGHGGPG